MASICHHSPNLSLTTLALAWGQDASDDPHNPCPRVRSGRFWRPSQPLPSREVRTLLTTLTTLALAWGQDASDVSHNPCLREMSGRFWQPSQLLLSREVWKLLTVLTTLALAWGPDASNDPHNPYYRVRFGSFWQPSQPLPLRKVFSLPTSSFLSNKLIRSRQVLLWHFYLMIHNEKWEELIYFQFHILVIFI